MICYFLVPLSNIVFVCTCVFLNRTATFEKLKNNNNKYQKAITKSKRTMHEITVKMLYGSQC